MTRATQGKKRAWLAAGSLLSIAALATAAAFTDFANLNLGTGEDGSGIGGNNAFNIQVVGTDENGNPVAGTWQEADSAEGVDIAIPGADTLTPGDAVSVEIPFRNQSPVLTADMSFSLQDTPGKTSDTEIASKLRYTVTLNGEELIADAPQTSVANLDLGEYAKEESGRLGITVQLPDQGTEEANNALQEKVSYVQAHFDAVSVHP